MRLSIIVPVLNEAAQIAATLAPLQPLRTQGHEIIVVDGGSDDGTAEYARPFCDQLVNAPRGRAGQMNIGAKIAQGDVVWFLHADTLASVTAAAALVSALSQSHHAWGRFDVRLSGSKLLLRAVETFMNLRSRWTGIATGDQGIFVRRDLFDDLGGYPDIPLMEDIALSRLLKRQGAPVCLRERLITSSRRWEKNGVARTIILMWRLRFAYWRGVSPDRLAMRYR